MRVNANGEVVIPYDVFRRLDFWTVWKMLHTPAMPTPR